VETRNILILLFATALGLSLLLWGCGPKRIPKWNGKMYAFDAETKTFRRMQEGEVVLPQHADGYIAFKPEHFASFVSTYIISCDKWKGAQDLVPMDELWDEVGPGEE